MRIKLTMLLDHEQDKDILNYLDGMSSVMRNRLVKDLLRSHISGEMNTNTVKDQLQDIIDMLKGMSANTISYPRADNHGLTTVPCDVTSAQNDALDILANLDRLGL